MCYPRGSWCISGLLSLDTSPTVRSIPSTLFNTAFPTHLHYVAIYFCCILPVSVVATSQGGYWGQLPPCDGATTDTWAPLLSYHTNTHPQVVYEWKDRIPLVSLKYFPPLPPNASSPAGQQTYYVPGTSKSLVVLADGLLLLRQTF